MLRKALIFKGFAITHEANIFSFRSLSKHVFSLILYGIVYRIEKLYMSIFRA